MPLGEDADCSRSSANPQAPNWDKAELKDLLDIWGEKKIQRLLEDGHHNKSAFQYIAEQMQLRDRSRDVKPCRCKIKVMKWDLPGQRCQQQIWSKKANMCIL